MEKLLIIINRIRVNKGFKTIDIITANMNLRNELGFDSLDLAELTVRIENEFNIDVFEDGIVTTVGEILRKIEE